jgi:hypothetical protein
MPGTRSPCCGWPAATAASGCCARTRTGALLLERLGRPLHQLGLPPARRHEILCATAERVWHPAPGSGLPTGADKGRWLAGYIEITWAELDRPCSERVIEHALACAARRVAAHDDERAVLVHGDVHQWNVLGTPDGGFKLVDPDGLLAEAEYDLGILMREDPVELRHGDPADPGALAGPAVRPRRHRDLGVGRGRAGVDRAARRPDRPAAARPRDARHRRPRSRLPVSDITPYAISDCGIA